MTLRAVGTDEKASPKTVSQAADSGSQRDLLVAMRTRIARTIEDPKCPPRDLAALSRRLMDIAREIETLDSEDGHDDIGTAASTPDAKWDGSAI